MVRVHPDPPPFAPSELRVAGPLLLPQNGRRVSSEALFYRAKEGANRPSTVNSFMPYLTVLLLFLAVSFGISSMRSGSKDERRMAIVFVVAMIGTGFIDYVAWVTMQGAV